MKKLFLSVVATALLAVPAVHAQKVNEKALLAKIEKSNAEIADPKKNERAATWLNRGNLFYEVAVEPTKSLFVNMEVVMLKLAIGEPTSIESTTLQGNAVDAWVYPFFTAYIKDGKVFTWRQTRWIDADAVTKSMEAFNRAFELDPKLQAKVKEGLKQLSDFSSQAGNTNLDLGEFVASADAYLMAFNIQATPAHGDPQPMLLYFAGYLRTMDGATNPASFAIGGELLNKALEMGYTDEDGSIYYYLFHCYYGQKDKDSAFVIKAKDALLAGISKFPKNERILEALMQLYTSEEGVGDPADLISLIDAAIADNPENTDLLFGRGRVFYALKNYDESIASFKRIAEIKPDAFDSNYYLGLFYTIKADAMFEETNTRQYSSQAAYNADISAANKVYAEAIPWFERAHEINPADFNTIDFLKQLSFRLYDEPGMSAKYDKYNAIWKEMNAQQ